MAEYALQISGDASRAVQAFESGETSAKDFDAALEQLTQGVYGYNESAGRFTDASGNFASGLNLLNDLGIQTTEQIENQIYALDRLQQEYQDDAAASAQLAERQEMLAMQLRSASQATQRFSGRANQGTNAAADLGFVLNDAAQFSFGFSEGIRSIANNLPNLIHNMKATATSTGGLLSLFTGTGGLILAVNAASTAAVLFGDKLFGAGEKAEEAKDKFAGLLEVVGELPQLQAASVPQLERAVELAKERLATLKEEVKEIRETGAPGSGTALELVTDEDLERLAETKDQITLYEGVVKSLTGTLDEREQKLTEINTLRAVGLRTEEKIEETFRRQAKEMDSLLGKYNMLSLVFQQVADTAEEARGKGGDGDSGDRTTLLEEEIEKRKELKKQLKDLAGAGARRYVQLERQNQALQRQITLAKDIARIRLNTAERPDPSSIGVRGMDQNAVDLESPALVPLQANIDQIMRLTNSDMFASLEKFDQLAQNLTQTIQGGLTGALSTLASSFGEVVAGVQKFDSLGDALLKSLGGFAQQVGTTLIGFGTAGVALQTFNLNPYAAIAAGAGLVALGSMLKSSVSQQTESFASGRGISRGGGGPTYNYGPRFTGAYRNNNDGAYPEGDINFAMHGGGGSEIRHLSSTVAQLGQTVSRLERNGLQGTLTSERGFVRGTIEESNYRQKVIG